MPGPPVGQLWPDGVGPPAAPLPPAAQDTAAAQSHGHGMHQERAFIHVCVSLPCQQSCVSPPAEQACKNIQPYVRLRRGLGRPLAIPRNPLPALCTVTHRQARTHAPPIPPPSPLTCSWLRPTAANGCRGSRCCRPGPHAGLLWAGVGLGLRAGAGAAGCRCKRPRQEPARHVGRAKGVSTANTSQTQMVEGPCAVLWAGWLACCCSRPQCTLPHMAAGGWGSHQAGRSGPASALRAPPPQPPHPLGRSRPA